MFNPTVPKQDLASFYYYALSYKLSSLCDFAPSVRFQTLLNTDMPTIASGCLPISRVLDRLFSLSVRANRKNVGKLLLTCIAQRVIDGQLSGLKASHLLIKLHRERLLTDVHQYQLVGILDDFELAEQAGVGHEYAIQQLHEFFHEYSLESEQNFELSWLPCNEHDFGHCATI